jgi:hypothetical protein
MMLKAGLKSVDKLLLDEISKLEELQVKRRAHVDRLQKLIDTKDRELRNLQARAARNG